MRRDKGSRLAVVVCGRYELILIVRFAMLTSKQLHRRLGQEGLKAGEGKARVPVQLRWDHSRSDGAAARAPRIQRVTRTVTWRIAMSRT